MRIKRTTLDITGSLIATSRASDAESIAANGIIDLFLYTYSDPQPTREEIEAKILACVQRMSLPVAIDTLRSCHLADPHSDAEDLVNDVYVMLIKLRTELRPDAITPAWPWFQNVIKFEGCNFARKANRRAAIPIDREPVASDPTPLDAAIQREEAERIQRAVGSLSPARRDAINRLLDAPRRQPSPDKRGRQRAHVNASRGRNDLATRLGFKRRTKRKK